MRTITLAELRTAARQYADQENSTFVTDAELNRVINNSIAELYEILLKQYGEDYNISSNSFNLVSGTSTYSLPTDFLKLRGADLKINADETVTLKRFNFNERNRRENARYNGLYDLRYTIKGDSIVFSPKPNITNQITLWYAPHAVKLASDSDTFNGYNGWEEYVIVNAAIFCLQKEESDVTVLMMQKQALTQRIISSAPNRDMENPETVSDVQATYNNPFGSGWGNGWSF